MYFNNIKSKFSISKVKEIINNSQVRKRKDGRYV